MAFDGLWDVFTDQAMGALTEGCNTGDVAVSREDQDAFAARSHQPGARGGRVRGAGRRDRAGPASPSAVATTWWSSVDEGVRPDTDAGRAGPAAAGLRRAGRHDHRRFGEPDLRRGGRRRRGQPGRGRAARADRARRDRGARAGGRARTPRCSCSPRRRSSWRSKKQGISRVRPGPDRDQRGVRGRRCGQRSGARADRRPRSTSGSTSTAARSPSATRSGRRVRGWSCTSRWSCSAGVRGSRSPRCAAVEDRATR